MNVIGHGGNTAFDIQETTVLTVTKDGSKRTKHI